MPRFQRPLAVERPDDRGEVRRRQAERVRARHEEMRVEVGREKLEERRRELLRELAVRRAAIVIEMRAKLRDELRGLRVEVRRLKRQRARLEAAQRANLDRAGGRVDER